MNQTSLHQGTLVSFASAVSPSVGNLLRRKNSQLRSSSCRQCVVQQWFVGDALTKMSWGWYYVFVLGIMNITHTDGLYLDSDRHVGHSKVLLLLFTTMRSFPLLSGLAVMYSWSRSQRSRSPNFQQNEAPKMWNSQSPPNDLRRKERWQIRTRFTCCNACHVCIGIFVLPSWIKKNIGIVQFQCLDLVSFWGYFQLLWSIDSRMVVRKTICLFTHIRRLEEHQ